MGRCLSPPCGYLHLDLKVLSQLPQQARSVFVAIARATRDVWGNRPEPIAWSTCAGPTGSLTGCSVPLIRRPMGWWSGLTGA